MWLNRRLAVASRGAGLLEQKLRILMAEEQRFALLAERTQVEWEAAVTDLERWMLRSALLSGERGLRLASGVEVAEVAVQWRQTMGVRYPAWATCRIPEPTLSDPLPANTALVQAVGASRRAVQAAVDQAVAATALAAVRAEIVSTRRQLRAVRDRWTPRLESARRDLTIALDDQEHDEGVRMRWAAAPTRGGTVPR
jgi:V/A-type H+-transporting ATPase subunit D